MKYICIKDIGDFTVNSIYNLKCTFPDVYIVPGNPDIRWINKDERDKYFITLEKFRENILNKILS